MVAKGYFVIADITGYTAYLTQSGLEDAQGVLNVLFEGLLDAIRPPLQVSNQDGIEKLRGLIEADQAASERRS